MQQAKHLVTAIKNITSPGDLVMMAKVVSVDKDLATCDVDFNDLEIGEVRLQANIKTGQKGIKVFPLPGSWVLVQKLGKEGNYFIAMVSEVEDFLLEVDGCSFQVTGDGFLIQKDGDSQKEILSDFIDQVMQLVVPTNVGPSGVPINNPAFSAIKTRIQNLYK